MKIIYKSISELIPYINNPRRNDKAIDAVASSIKNFGFKNPIIIDSKNEIVAGHTRLRAAEKLGMNSLPCVVADDLTDSQIKAFRIADNRVSEASEWDNDLLRIELDGLEEFTGFSEDDIEELNFENVGYKEKEKEEKKTKLNIAFESPSDLKKVEEDLRRLFNKYDKLKIVISSGEV
jgi:site-specific DNA-methyltransferase (adenine-specific)